MVDAGGTCFAPSWLQGKTVAPVPAGSQIDVPLTRRIAAGCRAVDAADLLCADITDGVSATTTASRITSGTGSTGIRPPALLWTPDLQGAVLFPETGYALIAGTAPFMASAVGEGVDTARARFGRYARTLSAQHPVLTSVAAAYPPAHRAWSRPGDVEPASAAARQLTLLHEFMGGTRSGPEFAQAWWDARRASQANGERIKDPLASLFDRIFMILEDYSVDPEFREPGDLSDSELLTTVTEIWDVYRQTDTEHNG
ncbi:hypothetical protein SGLAM104S_01466 [Streptomyces glaucescens]